MIDRDRRRSKPRNKGTARASGTTVTTSDTMAFRSFECMGTRIGMWVEARDKAKTAFATAESFLRDFERRLSRFDPNSELCRLNDDPRPDVSVSPLMAQLIDAALDAALSSGGLVDPTLLPEIERAGYKQSLVRRRPAPIADMLAAAPSPRPAQPHPDARWRRVRLDRARNVVSRPPGLRIDSGGIGKGLAADMVATLWRGMLRPDARFAIDCGGDVRVGGPGDDGAPYLIDVVAPHPATGEMTLALPTGAVATSGIGARAWHDKSAGFAHHLLDPATGRPAWTGLASVTAVAATAARAETLAKTALLSGPQAAPRVLARFGGATVDFAGKARVIDAARPDLKEAA